MIAKDQFKPEVSAFEQAPVRMRFEDTLIRDNAVRKIIWITLSLSIIITAALLSRDMFVGILLERHTAQTCGKLLGGDCTFSYKVREGNSLVLHDVTVNKPGIGSANAQDIIVTWQYGWQPPFVLFDVKINKLRGDAGMLPLYAVWRAVKHASGRKGIRLRNWSFDDIALRTPTGEVVMPSVQLSGDKGDVAVHAECFLPHHGTLNIASNNKGNWSLKIDKVPLQDLYQFANCWTGPGTLPDFDDMEGSLSAEAQYTSAGLQGNILIHRFSNHSIALANVTIGISSDKSLKNWELNGQLGTTPLIFKAKMHQGLIAKISGTLEGKNIPLNEVLLLGGARFQNIPLDGTINISGEFDNQGLFATFVPLELIWKAGNVPIKLTSVSEQPVQGKVWLNFSKGIERLWMDLDKSHLSLGSKTETTLDGNIELFKDAVKIQNIKACCGNMVVEASLLGSRQGPNTLLIAEGGKTKIGAWKVNRLEAVLNSSMQLQSMRFEGKGKAASVQKDLKSLGIEWKDAPDLPGKVWLNALYTEEGQVEMQGKWKSEPFNATGTLQGSLDKDGIIALIDMDLAVDLLALGPVARYELEKTAQPSFINLNKQTVDIFGKWNLPAMKDKAFSTGNFHVYGPWKNITYKSDLPPKSNDRLF